MSSGSTGLNLGIYHQHGFYEDKTGDNTGYTTTGLFDDRKNLDKYKCYSDRYDDNRMRKAQSNIARKWTGDKYNAVTNNCQDYIDDLIKEYNKILHQENNIKKGIKR